MGQSLAKTIAFAVLIAALGAGAGLAANALRTDGLALNAAAAGGPSGGAAAACSAAGRATKVPEMPLADARVLYGLPNVGFVDARPASAYWAGHIQGAINLPYEVAVEAAGKTSLPVPRDHRLLVYCDYVNCRLSSEL